MGSLLNKLRDKKANPIHSFFEFSLTTCCLPGTAWGSRGAVMNTTDTTPLVYSLSGKMVIRHIITVSTVAYDIIKTKQFLRIPWELICSILIF